MTRLLAPLTCGALAVLASSGYAAVTFSFQADKIYNSDGSAAVAAGMEFLVIAHEASTGTISPTILASTSTAVGSYVNGNSDRIIASGTTSNGGIASLAKSVPYDASTGLAQGDALEIVWFPSVSSSSTYVPFGASYGAYTSSVAKDGSQPFVAPTDGTNGYNVDLYTTAGGYLEQGTTPASAGYASFVAVPEPSSFLLMSGAVAWLGFRRSRDSRQGVSGQVAERRWPWGGELSIQVTGT